MAKMIQMGICTMKNEGFINNCFVFANTHDSSHDYTHDTNLRTQNAAPVGRNSQRRTQTTDLEAPT